MRLHATTVEHLISTVVGDGPKNQAASCGIACLGTTYPQVRVVQRPQSLQGSNPTQSANVAKSHDPHPRSLPHTVRLLLDTVYSLESFILLKQHSSHSSCRLHVLTANDAFRSVWSWVGRKSSPIVVGGRAANVIPITSRSMGGSMLTQCRAIQLPA